MRSPTPANIAAARATTGSIAGRDKNAYLGDIDGIVFGEDPSEGFVRGRRFLHPRLGFTFTAPDGFALENTAQAVLGVRHGGGQALRLDVVRVPAEQTLGRLPDLRLDRGYRRENGGGDIDQRLCRRPPRPRRAINGTSGSTPSASAATSTASSSRPSITRPRPIAFSTKSVGTFRRMSLAEIQGAKAAASANHHSCAGRHGREAGDPHGGGRPSGRALPRAQRA